VLSYHPTCHDGESLPPTSPTGMHLPKIPRWHIGFKVYIPRVVYRLELGVYIQPNIENRGDHLHLGIFV